MFSPVFTGKRNGIYEKWFLNYSTTQHVYPTSLRPFSIWMVYILTGDGNLLSYACLFVLFCFVVVVVVFFGFFFVCFFVCFCFVFVSSWMKLMYHCPWRNNINARVVQWVLISTCGRTGTSCCHLITGISFSGRSDCNKNLLSLVSKADCNVLSFIKRVAMVFFSFISYLQTCFFFNLSIDLVSMP